MSNPNSQGAKISADPRLSAGEGGSWTCQKFTKGIEPPDLGGSMQFPVLLDSILNRNERSWLKIVEALEGIKNWKQSYNCYHCHHQINRHYHHIFVRTYSLHYIHIVTSSRELHAIHGRVYYMTRNARWQSRRPRYKAVAHVPNFDTLVPAP